MTRKGSDLEKRKKDRRAIRGELRKVVKRKKQDENKEAREGVAVVVTNSDLEQGRQRSVAPREDTRTVPTKKTKAAVDKPGSTVGGGKSSGFLTSKPKASRASKEKKPNILAGMSGGEKDTIRAGWDQHRTEADQRGGGSRSEETTASMPSMTAEGPLGALSKDLRTGLTVNRDHLNRDNLGTEKGIQSHQKNLEKGFSQTVSGSTLRRMSEDFAQTVSGTHFLCPECHILTPTSFVSSTPGRMGARCVDCAGQ